MTTDKNPQVDVGNLRAEIATTKELQAATMRLLQARDKELEAEKAKSAKLEELVWQFDDYVVHTRKCSNESYPKCTCGLSELRELRPEYNEGVKK